jgi:hypothetical protein
MIYYARRRYQNFADNENAVDNASSGSWTLFGLVEDTDHIVDFQGVYFNGTGGDFLTLRDKYGNIIYYTVNATPMLEPDILVSPITIRLPIEYLTNASGSSIRVFGKYM